MNQAKLRANQSLWIVFYLECLGLINFGLGFFELEQTDFGIGLEWEQVKFRLGLSMKRVNFRLGFALEQANG